MKTTVNEMGASIGQVIPVAAQLKIKTAELNGSIAVLTKNGLGTSESITGVKAALSNIIKPSKEASEEAERLGLKFNVAHLQSVGWAEFLKEVRDKTQGNTETMGKLFGSVEALNAVMSLTSDTGMKDMNNVLLAMENAVGATDKAFEQVTDTKQQRFLKSINNIKVSLVGLGDEVAPLVDKLSASIENIGNKIGGLSGRQLELIAKVGLTVAALGPLLLVGGKVVTVVSGITKGFAMLKTAFAVANGSAVATTSGVKLLSGAMTLLTGPVGLTVAGIAGLTAGFVALYKHNEGFKNFADGIGDSMRGMYSNVKSFFFGKDFKKDIEEMSNESVAEVANMSKEIEGKLLYLKISGGAVTKDFADDVVKAAEDMKDRSVKAAEERYQRVVDNLNLLSGEAGRITEQERTVILYNAQKQKNDSIKKAAEMANGVIEQIKKMEEEGTKVTDEMKVNMLEKFQDLKEQAISILADNQLQQKAILMKLKAEEGKITAEQAAEAIKNAKAKHDELIKQAEASYDEQVKAALQLKNDVEGISDERIQEIINGAKKEKDSMIAEARATKEGVVKEISEMAAENIRQVDTSTGKMLTGFQKFRRDYLSGERSIVKDLFRIRQDHRKDEEKHQSDLETIRKQGSQNYRDLLKNDAYVSAQEIANMYKNMEKIPPPKLKLPKFNVSGAFNLQNNSVPSISVNWYDKGGIFNRPSIIGVGEKRPEFVGALDDLRVIVRDAMEEVSGKGSGDGLNLHIGTFNNYTGQDLEELMYEIELIKQRKALAYGR